MTRRFIAQTGFAAFWMAASPANAAVYCVTCDGPAAQYACTLDAAPDTRLQIYCITELAKSGHHESCAINRSQQATCSGVPRTLAVPEGLAETIITPPADRDVKSRSAPEAPASEKIEAGSDQTASPAQTDQAPATEPGPLKATASALQKAGSAVESATKKVWSCVTSLFGDC